MHDELRGEVLMADTVGHVLEIKSVCNLNCNHPAPGGNIILKMGGNSTWDWLRKTL